MHETTSSTSLTTKSLLTYYFVAILFLALNVNMAIFNLYAPIVFLTGNLGVLFLLKRHLPRIYNRFCLFLLFAYLLYQNFSISLFSHTLTNQFAFKFLHGLNFVLIGILFLTSQYTFIKERAYKGEYKYIYGYFVVIMVFILPIYMIVGYQKADALSVIIYFRTLFNPMLFFFIGLVYSEAFDFQTLNQVFRLFFIPTLIISMLELLYPEHYYQFINAIEYFSHRYRGSLLYDISDLMLIKKRLPFNTHLFKDYARTIRIGSTIMNPISYAYIVAFFTIFAITAKSYLLFGLCLVALLAIGSKGPLLILFYSLISFKVLKQITTKPKQYLALVALSLVFILALLYFGRSNEHIKGFLSGCYNLVSNPLGSGLGYGGNLSIIPNDMRRFSLGSESAIGVIFTQMGIFGASILLFYGYVIYRLFILSDSFEQSEYLLFPIYAHFNLIGGIFQEEAFSPYALGLCMFFVGYLTNGFKRDCLNEGTVFSTE